MRPGAETLGVGADSEVSELLGDARIGLRELAQEAERQASELGFVRPVFGGKNGGRVLHSALYGRPASKVAE